MEEDSPRPGTSGPSACLAISMDPYRAIAPTPEAQKPPKSKLPWILLVAGGLHAALLGAGALAHPVATAEASPRGQTVTVLGGHVDEQTGNMTLNGYQVVTVPAAR